MNETIPTPWQLSAVYYIAYFAVCMCASFILNFLVAKAKHQLVAQQHTVASATEEVARG